MQILIFEANPLIGEDLRDSARATGAQVRYVRHAPSAKSALQGHGHGVIIVMSGRSLTQHQRTLLPVFDEMQTRVVLFAPGRKIIANIMPEAMLPDPFTERDITETLNELLRTGA